MTALVRPRWRTSSYSDNGGDCVEVATNLAAPLGTVPVRDSKVQGGPVVTLAAPAFTALVDGLRDGVGFRAV
ncbi:MULTISPECIES: DUF397 domain-containing protein [unclassified Streptomyces]|uniref:DUF397 domain-containing protein n=1 Tax=unclassified Streptomyces TaxID=2593676 RepID=UPI0037FEE2FD